MSRQQGAFTAILVSSLALALTASLAYLMWSTPSAEPNPNQVVNAKATCDGAANLNCLTISEPNRTVQPPQKSGVQAIDPQSPDQPQTQPENNSDGSASSIIVSNEVSGTEPAAAPVIQTFNHRNPAFSPDGTRLTFECDTAQQSGQVCVGSLDQSEPVRVLSEADGRVFSQPQWSPDGERIAMLCNFKLCLWSEENGVQNLFEATHFESTVWTHRWSPDGAFVLIVCGQADAADLCAVNVGAPYALNLSAMLKRLGVVNPVLVQSNDEGDVVMECAELSISVCAEQGQPLGSPYTLAAALSMNAIAGAEPETLVTMAFCALPLTKSVPACAQDEPVVTPGGGDNLLSDGG